MLSFLFDGPSIFSVDSCRRGGGRACGRREFGWVGGCESVTGEEKRERMCVCMRVCDCVRCFDIHVHYKIK